MTLINPNYHNIFLKFSHLLLDDGEVFHSRLNPISTIDNNHFSFDLFNGDVSVHYDFLSKNLDFVFLNVGRNHHISFPEVERFLSLVKNNFPFAELFTFKIFEDFGLHKSISELQKFRMLLMDIFLKDSFAANSFLPLEDYEKISYVKMNRLPSKNEKTHISLLNKFLVENTPFKFKKEGENFVYYILISSLQNIIKLNCVSGMISFQVSTSYNDSATVQKDFAEIPSFTCFELFSDLKNELLKNRDSDEVFPFRKILDFCLKTMPDSFYPPTFSLAEQVDWIISLDEDHNKAISKFSFFKELTYLSIDSEVNYFIQHIDIYLNRFRLLKIDYNEQLKNHSFFLEFIDFNNEPIRFVLDIDDQNHLTYFEVTNKLGAVLKNILFYALEYPDADFKQTTWLHAFKKSIKQDRTIKFLGESSLSPLKIKQNIQSIFLNENLTSGDFLYKLFRLEGLELTLVRSSVSLYSNRSLVFKFMKNETAIYFEFITGVHFNILEFNLLQN